MTHKQRADQGRNMQSIGVGVGEDADFVIAQFVEIFDGGVYAQGHGDIVDFL